MEYRGPQVGMEGPVVQARVEQEHLLVQQGQLQELFSTKSIPL